MRLVRTRHARAAPAPARAPDAGQSLVEFALVLMPLFLILLGIIQFGFIFNTYVTMTNAAREGARAASVYVYQSGCSKTQNDALRSDAAERALRGAMNMLTKASPQYAVTTASPPSTNCAARATWTTSNGGLTFTNGDLVVTYANPSALTETDARVGQQITVRATYHQDLIIPLIAQLLPRDANGRLGMTTESTMVIN
ncbi:MAG: TadE/TadG family type IV pilus assembly protein [Chloroflexota bacterium]